MFKPTTCLALLCGGAVTLSAGTLVMKDGEKISGITISAIENGNITIEKKNQKRTFPLNRIQGYYETDIKTEDGAVEELADYKISVMIKAPRKGIALQKEKGRNKKVVETFDISYHISPILKKNGAKRVKAPYFYLYVLFSGEDDSYGHRPMKIYYYPKEAKGKSHNKTPDRVSILTALNDFKRPTIYLDNLSLDNRIDNQQFQIAMKGAPVNRKIIAWHLEVYGNQELLLEKNDRTMNERVPNGQWWKNY
ncbi:MAG: hypothetical protein PHQ27_08390 [Victivallales bacterium]|nr:hypothetical protein [Victivallales bacterium]